MLPAAASAQSETPLTEAQVDSIAALYDTLDELVITGKRETIRSDGATLTYDLQEDDSSKGRSVLDALRKVPMVTVDSQDNIQIKGRSDFKIQVNGKDDPMMQANASRILKAMPAESVAKIEVITEPGAKYDAEGFGGILNLITETKQKREGYAGNISLNGSNRQYGASAFASVKYRNFNADANLNWGDNHGLGQQNGYLSTTCDSNSEQAYKRVQETRQNFNFSFLSGGLNMSWEPNADNLFSWGGNVMYLDASVKDMTMTERLFNRRGTLMSGYDSRQDGDICNLGAGANAGYRHNFDSEGHNIAANYVFAYGRNVFDIGTHILPLEELGGVSGLPYSYQRSENHSYDRSHTLQLDYTNPFGGKKHLLDAGMKGVWRRNNVVNGMSYTPLQNIPAIPDVHSSIDQLQDIYAIYGSYTGNFDKVSVKGGVRYEHTRMALHFPKGEEEDFASRLDDVVPNAAVSYNFGPAHSLRLAYQMRISRPSVSQMNPFRQALVPTKVNYGNPDLRSERLNSLMVTYSKYGRILGGNISLQGGQTNNSIEQYSYIKDGIEYSTYGNVGCNRNLDLSGFLNINITNSMTLTLNGSVNYTLIKSEQLGLSNHGWGGNYSASWSWTGPLDIKFQAYGGQGFRNINLTGWWGGWYYYGLGISRNFLKDKKLNVALNANNFVQGRNRWRSYMQGPGFEQDTRGWNKSWSVGLSVSWSFGSLQERAKTTGKDTDSDEIKKSSSKSTGIGL